MIWVAYNALFTAAYLLVLPKFLWRMARRGGYRQHFMQRVGLYDRQTLERLRRRRSRIWVHAVSVGETLIARHFMEEWRLRQPERTFVLSVTTSTARRMAEGFLHPEDALIYFPVDFVPSVRRVLSVIEPAAIVLTECEIWPNLIREARRRGIMVGLMNGRVSDRSFRGYRRIRFFIRRVLEEMNSFCVQGDSDRERLLAIGAPPARVCVTGNAKYDIVSYTPEASTHAEAVFRRAGFAPTDPILLGGSTWRGEEAALLEAFKRLRPEAPGLRLVLAPRHVERAAEVEALFRGSGIAYVRRSALRSGEPPSQTPDALLLDTTGELRNLYAKATVIFVGKSLTCRGGQNIIEPAVFGKPIVVGPHLDNFRDVERDFLEAKALVQVRSTAELEGALRELLLDPVRRWEYGARAHEVVRSRRGALARTVSEYIRLLS